MTGSSGDAPGLTLASAAASVRDGSASAASWTCFRLSGNGSGSSPGFSSEVPTHENREKMITLSNQSSRFILSLLLTFRVKYRVVRDRTIVPCSFSRPRPAYSTYNTGFCESSLASEPIRPSLSAAS